MGLSPPFRRYRSASVPFISFPAGCIPPPAWENEKDDTDMTRIIALALAIAAGSMATASDDEKLTDAAAADRIRATLNAQG